MYVDSKFNRVLTKHGEVFVSNEEICRRILTGKPIDDLRVLPTQDSMAFDVRYGKTLTGVTIDAEDPTPEDHTHTDEQLDELLNMVMASPRLRGDDVETDRIAEELDYFIRSNSVVFILRVTHIIAEFEKTGVVWGVGRGSSCSSFILYLLRVNDVNPLKHGINFSELSKENNREDFL
jgi:DNA polymerase III alpha subunit